MKAIKTYLLIGNSRWHWAINYENQWNYSHTKAKEDMLNNLNTKSFKWASVGELPTNETLLDNFQEITIKDIPLKNIPLWLGIDRALSALGAVTKAKKNKAISNGIIIADAGTILSVTCIQLDGTFLGGQLVPGLKLQISAMVGGAKNLKDPGILKIPSEMFPRQTHEAMQRGSLEAVTGCLANAQKHLNMPIWLCGGDSDLLIHELKRQQLNVEHHPNLVLEGMIEL